MAAATSLAFSRFVFKTPDVMIPADKFGITTGSRGICTQEDPDNRHDPITAPEALIRCHAAF